MSVKIKPNELKHDTTPKTLDNNIKTKQTAIRTRNTDNSIHNTPADVSSMERKRQNINKLNDAFAPSAE